MNEEKSMLYNESLGLDNQLCYLNEREQLELEKIALYSLGNERMVKLFVGRKELFYELKNIYKKIVERLSDSKALHIYSYEATSLLITAEDNITAEEFEAISADVLEYLNCISLNDIQLSYCCAVVINKNEPLHKAEKALKYGIENKLRYVEYTKMKQSIPDASEELNILQTIRDAISENLVVPYFQGIYDNKKKQFALYESLMRIQDKNGRIYYPDQFLPVAKEYNLYEELSIVMVKKVLGMFSDKDVCISVNLNVRDIYNREMIKTIFSALDKAERPSNFVFELVETEEVTDYDYIQQFSERVREKGAKIAIDDFGSGYSSLMHIIRIDADFIKIDGEIIRTICKDKKCREFVGIINFWCRSQKKSLIAEFAENAEIQEILEQMGVAYSQGYYFSKPEPWVS